MTRPVFRLIPILLGAAALLATCSSAIHAEDAPPNIVLIYVDDMGFGDIGCFRALGVPQPADKTDADAHYPNTPHMDRLAEQGLRLTQFYTASPICSPSRVALTTGQYPARHLINSYLNSRQKNRARGMQDFLDPKVPTIARTFKQAGYATAHFGKWHMGGGRDVDDAPLPTEYGFDESLVSFEGLGDRILPPGGLSNQSAKLGRGEITRVDKHEQTGIYVDRSLDFISRHQDSPFYLHLWLNDVHDGHRPAPGKEAEFAETAHNASEQRFFAVLTEMDRQIGRLVDQIDELGLGERTFILLTSDNGPTAWPHYYTNGEEPPGSTAGFRGRKWSLYEGGVRMPCIVRWTSTVPAGAINTDSAVCTLDLFPSLAAVAGIDLTKSLADQGVPATPSSYFDGINISEALLGKPAIRTRPLYWEYGRGETYLRPGHVFDASPNLALRDGKWKLLVNDDGSRLELYDFSQSITEFDNVAGRHQEVAASLKEQLLTWRRCLPALNPSQSSLEQSIKRQVGHTVHSFKAGDSIPAAASPAIASAPLAVTVETTSDGSDGVIVAQGGSAAGWALYLQDERLKFTTRVRGQETTFETDPPAVSEPTTISALLSEDGAMRMHVGQELQQVVMAPSVIPNAPGDGLDVGRDRKSPVGTYQSPFPWSGEVHKVTVAVGEPVSSGPPPTLATRFAADVDPQSPLPEYPRPQLVREQWMNLNGHWEYAIAPGRGLPDGRHDLDAPEKWDGRILVPFCVESALSGVRRRVGHDHVLWYRRTFTLPDDWDAANVILNFGAVDWESYVWVNGEQVVSGPHRGGYDPFSYRIGQLLKAGEENELVVRVWDPTDVGSQPRGKQVSEPRGIWYTPVTGIWQTVWLEAPPSPSISQVHCTPNLQQNSVTVDVTAGLEFEAPPALPIEVDVKLDGRIINSAGGETENGTLSLEIPIDDVRLWSPDEPFLYDLEVRVAQPGGDAVQSYFGMRSIALGPGPDGYQRLLFNGEPLFQFGPLDQGWWPDGLYTAPTDEALRYDIEATKRFGFNMARKHVKVEPARWYYWCDKLGLLVWQDLPGGMSKGKNQHVKKGQSDCEFSEDEHAQFMSELQAMIDAFGNHPSIVVWCPFNEGWGQHQTNEVLRWTKEYDPTRLVDGPSGWEDRGYGDMIDMHRYPGPDMFPPQSDRASVLGEYGGLGLPIAGHTWVDSNNWGYRTYTTRKELQENYRRVIEQLPALIANGLAAAVYTQTTDVEIEVNGLMTYDRQITKLDPDWLADLHRPLYEPPPKRTVLLPTSDQQPHSWRYTFGLPADADWTVPDFDDSGWPTGPGGFGTAGTPNTTIGTEWSTSDIWLRTEFTVEEPANFDDVQLRTRIHHDEDAEVYLNGEQVATFEGYVTGYEERPLPEAKLVEGSNVLAVHCRQTTGGQYIDVGVIGLSPR